MILTKSRESTFLPYRVSHGANALAAPNQGQCLTSIGKRWVGGGSSAPITNRAMFAKSTTIHQSACDPLGERRISGRTADAPNARPSSSSSSPQKNESTASPDRCLRSTCLESSHLTVPSPPPAQRSRYCMAPSRYILTGTHHEGCFPAY